MRWKHIKIGKKLAIGFGCLLVLLAITGYAGFDGIETVSHSLFVVGEQEAPLVDMANEMKIALLAARNALEEAPVKRELETGPLSRFLHGRTCHRVCVRKEGLVSYSLSPGGRGSG